MRKINLSIINYLDGYLNALIDINKNSSNQYSNVVLYEGDSFEIKDYLKKRKTKAVGDIVRTEIANIGLTNWLKENFLLNSTNLKYILFKIEDLINMAIEYEKFVIIEYSINELFLINNIEKKYSTKILVISYKDIKKSVKRHLVISIST